MLKMRRMLRVLSFKRVAQAKGADFKFLLTVAQRESSMRPDAQAEASTAAGLFQFLEQTWLEAVKRHGDKLGLAEDAAKIEFRDGRYEVNGEAAREDILNKRFDPEIASKIAVETFQNVKQDLQRRIGREAQRSELYLAHFLGAAGAARMINADELLCACDVAPAAARANKALFYENGAAVSVRAFLDKFIDGFQENAPGAPSQQAPAVASYRSGIVAGRLKPSLQVIDRPASAGRLIPSFMLHEALLASLDPDGASPSEAAEGERRNA